MNSQRKYNTSIKIQFLIKYKHITWAAVLEGIKTFDLIAQKQTILKELTQPALLLILSIFISGIWPSQKSVHVLKRLRFKWNIFWEWD